MKLDIKLENNFDYNHRLVDELVELLDDKPGSIGKVSGIENNGDHWLYINCEIYDEFKERYEVAAVALTRGVAVGFLEANRITCV